MGNTNTCIKINYEDMQLAMSYQSYNYIIINTLNRNEQSCLIEGTLHADSEEDTLNRILSDNDVSSKKIIVYGKNCNDENADKKCAQLVSLGFKCVYLYRGGLFEWLLLQDIYGKELFPTTSKELDILKYKQPSSYGVYSKLIEYG